MTSFVDGLVDEPQDIRIAGGQAFEDFLSLCGTLGEGVILEARNLYHSA